MSISDWISDVCSSDLADVTYTFGQVGIDQAYVSDKDNCGNLSAAVGVYAIEAGSVLPTEPETEVRIFNTNVRQILISRVPVRGGRPEVVHSLAITGAPGLGAANLTDYDRNKGA